MNGFEPDHDEYEPAIEIATRDRSPRKRFRKSGGCPSTLDMLCFLLTACAEGEDDGLAPLRRRKRRTAAALIPALTSRDE